MNKNSNEQNVYQAEMFKNRLTKKYKTLKKWAKRERITCFRLYDRDIPEIPLAVDLYEFLPFGIEDKLEAAEFLRNEDARISQNDLQAAKEKSSRIWLVLQLFERPYEKSEESEQIWLLAMKEAAADALGIVPEKIVAKVRKHQRGISEQYEAEKPVQKIEGIVQECGNLFRVNLNEHLDTGLFLDHRPLRSALREKCAGKRVLNLFCYTGSFSVFAAEGRASFVKSVDLNRNYLSWTESNLALNGFYGEKYESVRADVSVFLSEEEKNGEKFDFIILDPPTFSNSKSTRKNLDTNKDWAELCVSCLKLLSPKGILYFSTNSKKIAFSKSALEEKFGSPLSILDITENSTPLDFKDSRPHKVWEIRL